MAIDLTLAEAPIKSCPPVVAPNVSWYMATHAAGEGAAPVIAETVAAGDPAFYGGIITLAGCGTIDLTITYIDNTLPDCTNCPPAANLVTSEFTITLDAQAFSKLTIPPGFWQEISYVVNGGAGVDAGQSLTVGEYSACVPDPCCSVVAI